MNRLFKIEDYIVTIEKFCIIAVVALLVILSFLQVFLRVIFHSGIVWLDPMLRHFVMWAGFIGAALSARYSKHFALDIFNKFASKRIKKYISTVILLITALASAFLFYAAFKFVRDEASAGSIAFYINHFAVKGWIAESILPISFLLIILHSLINIFRPESDKDSSNKELLK